MSKRVAVVLSVVILKLLIPKNCWSSEASSALLSDMRTCLKDPAACFSPSSSGSPVLVRIDSEVITTSDFQDRLNQIPGSNRKDYETPQARRQLLDSMIDDKVIYIAAHRIGLDREPRYRQQMAAFQDSLLRQAVEIYLGEPTESDVLKYYAEHKAEFGPHLQYSVTQYLLKTLADAQKARVFLNAGKPLASITKGLAGGMSVIEHQRIGFYAGRPRQSPMEKILHNLPKGQLSSPVQYGGGFLILRIDEKHSVPGLAPLQAKERIKRELENAKMRDWKAKARASLPVNIDEKALAAMDPSSPSPR
jgi:parvulin-like peptidyl-prolyl isomerase